MSRLVKVTAPEVIGVDPAEDVEDMNRKPFLSRPRSEEEIADYDAVSECGLNGGQADATKGEAWNRGWADAQG